MRSLGHQPEVADAALLQRRHGGHDTAVTCVVVRSDIHLRVLSPGDDLLDLGAQFIKTHGAVGLVLGVEFTAEVPVIAALGFHRQREDLLARIVGQGFTGDLGQLDFHALGQHRRGHHEDHQQHQHHVDVRHYVHLGLRPMLALRPD
ncbi:hypothetical protein D3C73_1239080 [compost metagenome]